jgi:hypothetical protein
MSKIPFWRFSDDVCAHDLDPAVDMLVERHPDLLMRKTKSGITFAEYMKYQCSTREAIQGTVNLLLKVHKAGCLIGVGTNQGYNTYKRLIDDHVVPAEDVYTVIYTCDHPNNRRPNPRTYQFPFAKKPSGKYFKG